MNVKTINFGKHLYRIEQPEPSWYLPSDNDLVHCSICKTSVSVTFGARTDPAKPNNTAAAYMIPTGIRCDCFLANSEEICLPYIKALNRQPVPIVPVKSLSL